MKKTIIIAAAMLLTIAAFAQDGKSIYNKYSKADNVSAVYISPAMFRMIGALPDMEIRSEDVNLTQAISSLSGMYLIDSDNPSINAGIRKDVEVLVKSGSYELLMEAKDDGEITRIYMLAQGETVKSFVLLTHKEKESTFICLEGELTKRLLEELILKIRK